MYYFQMEGTHIIKLFKTKALITVAFVANVNIAEISKNGCISLLPTGWF